MATRQPENSAMGPRNFESLWIPATSYADCVDWADCPEDGGRHKKRMRASSLRPDKTFAGAMMETAPTATVGMLLKTTDAPFYYDGDLSSIRFIESAAPGVLNVCYYYDGAL